MIDLLIPAATSFLITILSIPLVIYIAKKYGLTDNPLLRPHPAHVQKRVVPRAGGLAIFLGITICILLFIPIQKHIIGIITSMGILLAVGLLDDKINNFSPYLRLLMQVIAAILVVASGVGISFITNPFGGIIRLDEVMWIADLLALVWIIWVMNMLNWSKGVDGQMPGIVAVTTLILGFLSFKLFLMGDTNQFDIARLSFIAAGSSLAFLIVNWHPAKIFPGFSGSNILGLIVATLAILSGAKLATAGLVLLIPAADFVYTFLRRIASGRSPVWGDRGHLHHKLLDMGFSHQQISLFYILGSVILGAAALNLDSRGKFFAALLTGAGILGIILWLNFFGGLSKKPDPDNG
ncbi:undecaprenyl/decaprenyl-phosphate alpha-N-acetylglucosaminyl 1-phosphate transferase [Candidatus Daviesbacteria bacterium]|nr:undecaprenyl/decaprenyl-phosphate alpha-N-acetylglucosaminyl 1-phosphate transferase [Candidatus Daviesbacteria bacterium]